MKDINMHLVVFLGGKEMDVKNWYTRMWGVRQASALEGSTVSTHRTQCWEYRRHVWPLEAGGSRLDGLLNMRVVWLTQKSRVLCHRWKCCFAAVWVGFETLTECVLSVPFRRTFWLLFSGASTFLYGSVGPIGTQKNNLGIFLDIKKYTSFAGAAIMPLWRVLIVKDFT